MTAPGLGEPVEVFVQEAGDTTPRVAQSVQYVVVIEDEHIALGLVGPTNDEFQTPVRPINVVTVELSDEFAESTGVDSGSFEISEYDIGWVIRYDDLLQVVPTDRAEIAGLTADQTPMTIRAALEPGDWIRAGSGRGPGGGVVCHLPGCYFLNHGAFAAHRICGNPDLPQHEITA